MEHGNRIARPVGRLKIWPRGFTYFPKLLQEEIGIKGTGEEEVDYFIDANTVLLIRRGATLEEVLRGLDVLRDDLKLRASLNEPARKGRQPSRTT
jgi:hypothetical protein